MQPFLQRFAFNGSEAVLVLPVPPPPGGRVFPSSDGLGEREPFSFTPHATVSLTGRRPARGISGIDPLPAQGDSPTLYRPTNP